ncbi:hypothetical protein E3P77_03322 [Wallemia ichthyophaga]|nr:hypothetical protein E3P77_03322 [Wallemia ichthyophaga]
MSGWEQPSSQRMLDACTNLTPHTTHSLDMLNNSLQTTLRYVGFGAVAGAGSLFYLARRYQRRWALPAFAGGVSGTFLGQYVGAMSFASHFNQEGRDPRVVLQTLARISRESDVKRAQRMAGGGSVETVRGDSGGSSSHGIGSNAGSSRWDQLRGASGTNGIHQSTSATQSTPAIDTDLTNFPRSSEDFEYVSDSDRTHTAHTHARRAKVPLPGIARTAYDLRKPQSALSASASLTNQPHHSQYQSDGFIGRGTPPRGPPKQSLPVRTSKLSQKHVFLPGEIQTRALPYESERGESTSGSHMHRPPTAHEQQQEEEEERTSARFRLAERMGKEERERASHNRLTAYAVGERYKMRSLAAYSKREHNAWARQYDEAIYTVYHRPLLPGYSAASCIRSSNPSRSPGGGSIIDMYEEADELPQLAEMDHSHQRPFDDVANSPPRIDDDGFIREGSGVAGSVDESGNGSASVAAIPESNTDEPRDDADVQSTESRRQTQTKTQKEKAKPKRKWKTQLESVNDTVAEVIHFDYGVSVFYNMTESQERDILQDMVNAGVVVRPLHPDSREMEQCHYGQDSNIPSSRILNDFFTLKTNSHYLKLSLAHALAQSTKLSAFEELTLGVLDSASTIPKELAATGTLALDRRQAIRLTGKLFKLRVDVNLVSNVLDVPELFWSEAGLKALYDAGRDYFEIGARVQTLNERLAVAGDLLDIIHEHVNEQGMSRITIIIIWLIVIACLVAVGEVGARLALHALRPGSVTMVEGGMRRLMRTNKRDLWFDGGDDGAGGDGTGTIILSTQSPAPTFASPDAATDGRTTMIGGGVSSLSIQSGVSSASSASSVSSVSSVSSQSTQSSISSQSLDSSQSSQSSQSTHSLQSSQSSQSSLSSLSSSSSLSSASPSATLSDSDSSNDRAWIAGPIVGSIVGALALLGLLLFLLTRKRNKQRALSGKQAQEAALASGGSAAGGGVATDGDATNGAATDGAAAGNTTNNSNMLGVGAGAAGAAGAGAIAAASSRRSFTPSSHSHSRRDSLLARSNSDRSMFRPHSEHSFGAWEQQSRSSHDILAPPPPPNNGQSNNTNRHSVASPLDELVRSFSLRKANK